jgi:hypothetical protein
MTRLARVKHIRCQEIDGTTYFLVDADVTKSELNSWANSAVNAFLDAERAAKAVGNGRFSFAPEYHRYPEKTVAEVTAEHESARAKWELDETIRKESRKTFSQRVCELSQGRVKPHWADDDDVMEISVSWGHNHGLDKDTSGDEL